MTPIAPRPDRETARKPRARSARPGAVVLAAAAGLLLLACARSAYRPASDDPATTYMEACSSCHDGSTSAPVLAGRRLTPEAVERRLDRGSAGMPSFPGIRGEARKRLVAFVVEMSGGKSPTPQ